MKLVIKAKPEDFVVREVANLPLKDKGEFAIYLLQKRGWNTVGLLLELSRRLKVPFRDFSYGGKKDRYSLSSQYVSIKGVRLADTKEKDYALKFCGFLERPMGPDLIAANKFEVTVRKLSPADAQHGKEAISAVEAFGFPNYFDDQRFGSFVPEEGFLAERLLKGHFSGALKIYLSAKGNFFRNWKDWEACLESARREYEKKVFSYLAKNPKGFLVLLKQIPQEKMALYFSAYQAYLWNELLRRLIKEATFALRAYAGVCQDYLFYDRLREQDYLYLSSLALPTAAHNAQMPDGLTAQIYNRVLAENGIKKAMFNKLKIRQVYFKAVPRKAIVKPQNFSLTTLKDELYVQKQKIVLKFTLPRGSYATMLIKRLFAQ